jgi:hypothetical protein
VFRPKRLSYKICLFKLFMRSDIYMTKLAVLSFSGGCRVLEITSNISAAVAFKMSAMGSFTEYVFLPLYTTSRPRKLRSSYSSPWEPQIYWSEKIKTTDELEDEIVDGMIILSRDWLYTEFGLVIVFMEHLQNVTTHNICSVTELRTPKITMATAQINSSQSSLSVAW